LPTLLSHRLERLEIDAKSSQEQFEEISEGWSIVNQKVIPQDLQKALNSQQQLCTAIIQDKKKLINDLQQVNLCNQRPKTGL